MLLVLHHTIGWSICITRCLLLRACRTYSIIDFLLNAQQEEKKRAALVARANQAEDEELGWGDDGLYS